MATSGIQIGGRSQWRVERAKLEEFLDAYRRAGESLAELPDDLPGPTDKD